MPVKILQSRCGVVQDKETSWQFLLPARYLSCTRPFINCKSGSREIDTSTMSTFITTLLVETFIPGNKVENFVKVDVDAAVGRLVVEMINASYGNSVVILEREKEF